MAARKKTGPKRTPTPQQLENLKKGKGRPPGVPNKVTLEIKQFCRDLFDRPLFQKNLLKQWDSLELEGPFRLALLHYAFGKPKETIEHEVGATLHDLLREAVKRPDPGPR